MTIRMRKPVLFFKCVVLFVDLCVLRDLSFSIKHGHIAHKGSPRTRRLLQMDSQ